MCDCEDVQNMHYAVSKSLSEVKAYKAHIKELYDLLTAVCKDHNVYQTLLDTIERKYSHHVATRDSNSS